MALKVLIRPGVQIQQEILRNSPAISLPDQPTVIVGPNVQVVIDAADGTYDTTKRLSAYPELEQGAKVRLESVRVRLADAKLGIANGTDGTVLEDVLTSASVNFGSSLPVATSTTSAVAAAIKGLVAATPVLPDASFDLKVEEGVAPGSFVFSYNGVKSAEFVAWPNVDITIDGGEFAGAITFTPAAQAPVVLPATDTIDVRSSSFVKPGDVVRFGAQEPYTEAKVVFVSGDGLTVKLDREPGDGANLTFSILRERTAPIAVPANLVEETEDGFLIEANMRVEEAFNANIILQLPVVSAKVRVDYEAMRQLTANRLTRVDSGNVEDILMTIDVRNPLALGAYIALQNTVRSVFVMAVEEDSDEGYLKALSFLENEEVYSIACLTQSMTVATSLKTHVKGMSAREKSRFRIGFVNLEHQFEKGITDRGRGATFEAKKNEQDVTVVTLRDPNAVFSGAVLVGDLVQTFARPAEGENPTNDQKAVGIFRVREIMNNNRLRLEPMRLVGSDGVYAPEAPVSEQPVTAPNMVDYEVFRILDRDGQAEQIALTALAFGERRITYITNAECVVTVNDVDETVPGYYIAAAVAGMASGFPPHQGFTNMGISGIKSVHYANRYFNDNQMGVIAGQGGFLVVQDGETSPPVAYIQTTTDASDVKTRELSFTRVLDFYSSTLKNQLRKYIGPYNIYQATFTTLSNAVNAIHQEMMGMTFDRIGSPILAASLDKLEKDPTAPDGIVIAATIVIPMPLNNISVTVYA